MTRYAATTTVPADRSRSEIEKTLERYGATGFMYGTSQERALIVFEMHGRRVKFLLPLPARDDPEFTQSSRGARTETAAQNAYDQAVRQRWRALAIAIKAKLEAVETGITQFEEEFLAHIMLPDGSTVADFMVPQIESAYGSGQMPPLLPYYGGAA